MKVEIHTPDEKTQKAMNQIDKVLSKANFTFGQSFNILASLLLQGMATQIALRPGKQSEKPIFDMLAEMPKTLKKIMEDQAKKD